MCSLRLILGLVLSVSFPFCLAGAINGAEIRPGLVQEEFIYLSSPFPECHASTIVQSTAGTMITAWFGGLREKDPTVGIWVSRQEDGKWSVPVEVANGNQPNGTRLPCWNPVLFQPKDGPLMLFFKVGPTPADWWGEMMVSNDDGKTWGERKKLPHEGIGPVKNKPVQLASGEILCPSSDEKGGPWVLHLETTSDNGKTWKRNAPLHTWEEGNAIQPSILTYPDGRLEMLARNKDGNGKLWQIWSADGGKTWGKIEPTELPNPNSGTDAVTLKDGRQLLIYNHTNYTADPGVPKGREMINLAISQDGKDWKQIATLECTPKSEFSYPAIIQTKDGLVHAVYTWNRRLIKHMVFDPTAF